MSRYLWILVAFLTIGFGCSQPTGRNAVNEEIREIKVVTDLRNFAKTHPSISSNRLVKEPTQQARNSRQATVRYTLGGRVPGDRLVAQQADVYSYPAKKDVTIQLTYPQAGTGSVVTHVEILVTSDTSAGNAYIVAGGIGQRFISIVIEADQTEHFSYTAKVYGTD